jgi:hypothetical protein
MIPSPFWAEWAHRRAAVPVREPQQDAQTRGSGESPAVPQGSRIRDSRRRGLVSAPRRRLGEAGSRFDALTFDGAVDGGAANAEEFGDLGGAVLAAVHQ